MDKKEIINDPIYKALKRGEIGNVSDDNGIDTEYAIKMKWMSKNIPLNLNVCSENGKYRFYITDQADWKNIVFKSKAEYNREDAYRKGIMKMLKIFEKEK